MAGKSKGPKLHTGDDNSEHQEHEHYSRTEALCDALTDGDLMEDFLRSGIFEIDGLPDTPIVFHNLPMDSEGYGRILVGSPHGGPVFLIKVAEITPESAKVHRQCMIDIYDTREAEFWNYSLEDFRAKILDGGDFCDSGYIPPTPEGRAALGHLPNECPYRQERAKSAIFQESLDDTGEGLVH
jgi:hypothetical protein